MNVGYAENPWKAESNFLYRPHISIYNEEYSLRELDQAVHLMLFLKLTQMCGRNFEEPYLCQVCQVYHPGKVLSRWIITQITDYITGQVW